MKPKPFWPLNHFTVPVVIFFSKARERICGVTITQPSSTSSMSLEKEPAGAFNKAQRLIEYNDRMPLFGKTQGRLRSLRGETRTKNGWWYWPGKWLLRIAIAPNKRIT